AARPADFDAVDAGSVAEAEVKPARAGGTVTGAAAHPLALTAARGGERDFGPEAVPIALRAARFHLEPVAARGRIVSQQLRGAVVAGEQDVQAAVIVEIAVGGAAADALAAEWRSGGLADIGEAQAALAPEELAGLGVTQIVLEERDVILHVAVVDERVRAAVIVRVEEEQPEAQVSEVGAGEARFVGAIGEQPGAVLHEQRQRLVRNVGDRG